jgi:hypothetical protein
MRRDLTQLKWRAGAVAAAIVALLALAWRHDPADGVLTTTAAWPNPHPYISELKPVARTTTTDGQVKLTGGPAYFDVTPPTPYETVTVEATVDPQDAAAVRLGAMATTDGRFDVRAAYARPGAASEPLATAEATPPATVSGTTITYAVSARGAHRLFARVPVGESLHLSLLVQDMNRQAGADGARLTVFKAGSNETVKTVTLNDDGDVAPDWKALPPRELAVDWRPEAAGEYWLAFDGSDDLFIRQVTTPLREFGFLGRLYLGDEVGYNDNSTPATVFVTGRRMQAKAMNAEAVQTIAVAGRGLALPTVGEKEERELDGASLVVAPHRGLVLTTDGRITLNATAVSIPSAAIGTAQSRLRATFRTDELAMTPNGAYRFVLDVAPGEGGQPVVLSDVRLTWQRQPMSLGAWLLRLCRNDETLVSGSEPPRSNLEDFDEQIP